MYLKIENPGVCPPEGFTLSGASSKRGSGLIGQFGTGNKKAAALLLREGLAPIIYCSNHSLEFGTKAGKMAALEGDTHYDRMFVKHGGKDDEGKSVTYTEDLSQTVEDGILDWDNMAMALREFVSNAIDASTTYNEVNNLPFMYPWDGVKVEIVEDNQVRAKKGYTRVFIPMSDAVYKFKENLGKWFLHFSEPDLIYRVQPNPILPKANRNLRPNQAAVIYRRGVRVREIGWSEDSLFDYNLDNLRVDESRNVEDYACASAAATALANADAGSLTKLLSSFMGTTTYWEHGFSNWDLRQSNNEAEKENRWEKALQNLGENAVLVQDNGLVETVLLKGYKPIKVPEAYIKVGEAMKKVRTASKVLNQDEKDGREIIPANDAAKAALDYVWNNIVQAGMTGGKEKPSVMCFRALMNAESITFGFHREGVVYINENRASGESVNLRATMLEELCHYITGAFDYSRDLQKWAFEYGIRIRMVMDGELPTGMVPVVEENGMIKDLV